jgi:hypothetical protein
MSRVSRDDRIPPVTGLILDGMRDRIDDDDVHGRALRLELQTELLFERHEERRKCVRRTVRGRCSSRQFGVGSEL